MPHRPAPPTAERPFIVWPSSAAVRCWQATRGVWLYALCTASRSVSAGTRRFRATDVGRNATAEWRPLCHLCRDCLYEVVTEYAVVQGNLTLPAETRLQFELTAAVRVQP